jgi:DNA invertase Pin-like site-specific DNA recombinase
MLALALSAKLWKLQIEQLTVANCEPIFRDQASGARLDRKQLQKLLKALKEGDTVIVTRIDRLARSTFDLFAIVRQVVDAGAQFRSLAEPWADTSTSTGRLMLAVLGGLADVERDLIRTRTAEGRSRAKARGVHLGRPLRLTHLQRREATTRVTGRLQHRPLAGVALPAAHRDVHVFRVELDDTGVTADLLRGDDGGTWPAERV